MEPKAYVRKYLRISPDTHLYGTVSIVRIGIKQVNTGITKVRVLNISTDGLKFVSSLKLPVDNTVILEISLKLDGADYCLQGYIVHANSTEVCEYEYGFCFLEPEAKLRESLMKLFSRHIVVFRLK